MHCNLSTVKLIAWVGESLMLGQAALHTWLGRTLLHQSISAGRAAFGKCRPELLTKILLSLHKQMTPPAFLPSFSHLWTVTVTQTPRVSFLLAWTRVHGRRGPGFNQHRFPESKCFFFFRTSQARSRGASAAQCTAKEKWWISKKLGLDSAHSVKPERFQRWLQV